MIKKTIAPVLSALLCCLFVSDATAQSGTSATGFGSATLKNLQSRNSSAQYSVNQVQNNLRNRSTPSIGTLGVNRRNFLGSGAGNSLSSKSKPFSSVARGPSVSPYLALSAPRASASDYQSIIRPQQRKQRENQRQQAFAIQRQRQLNQAAARAPYSTTGDENRAPTGHTAVFQSLGSFQNTGGYFPPPSSPKQR